MAVSIVADVLRDIYDRTGALTPGMVVEESRPEDAPLHNRFEWNDALAGEAWRRTQAREIIRSVKVEIVRGESKGPSRVRAFVHLPAFTEEGQEEDDTEASYVPQEIVAASDKLTSWALRDMERRWKELRRSYQEHREFWDLVRKDIEHVA